jgi:site-specific recombinase XerD
MTTEILLPARRPPLGGLVRLTSPAWDVTIQRLLDWFALVRGRAPLTIVTYARGLQGFLRFARAQDLLDPRAVTHREIEEYLGWLGSRGRRPALLNQHLSALRAFYRYLEREGVVPHNPAALAVGPKRASRLPAYLTIPEQERMLATLAAAATPSGQRDYAMVATALFTGLRCAELVTLRLDAVSFDGGFCRVVGKGSKTREVPLIPRLAAILTAYLRETRPGLVLTAESPYVFPANRQSNLQAWKTRRHGRGARPYRPLQSRRYRLPLGGPLTTRGFFYVVRVHCSAIVGRPVHPHMLRHSFASRLRAKGADLQLIQEILGHESINTTTMYAHISTPHRTATVARLLEEETP